MPPLSRILLGLLWVSRLTAQHLHHLAATPQTFVHGDWKLGNLGSRAGGTTVLLDWDRCGQAAGGVDLAWYLAVNCDRMPQSKEAAIAEYRRRLEAHGVDTSGWWDAQLALALLGGLVQLGWAKTAAGAKRSRIASSERLAIVSSRGCLARTRATSNIVYRILNIGFNL